MNTNKLIRNIIGLIALGVLFFLLGILMFVTGINDFEDGSFANMALAIGGFLVFCLGGGMAIIGTAALLFKVLDD